MRSVDEMQGTPPALEDFARSRGASSASGVIADFGDALAEYAALKSGCVAIPLGQTALLRVTGDDRAEFLHGQLSNDVKGLKSGEANVSLMLNVKGHALADLRVFRRDHDVILAVESGALQAVRSQLEDHIIFDQVGLEDLSQAFASVTLQGPSSRPVAEQVLNAATHEPSRFVAASFQGAQALVASSQRTALGGIDVHFAVDKVAALIEAVEDAGAVCAGEQALEWARVEAGIPKVASEAGVGVLPQEAGLEPFVSYTKGCYLGQEIMARIEARGSVRRKLVGLRLPGLPAPDRQEVVADGKVVGRVGTVVDHPELGAIALAVLRKDAAERALEVGGIMASAVELPFRAGAGA